MQYLIRIFLIITIFFQIAYITSKKIEFKFYYLAKSFTNNFIGELKLPKELVELDTIVKERNIKSFNLSEDYIQNDYLYQRTVEYLYPISLKKNSKIHVEFKNENKNNCDLIQTYNYLKITRCNLN